jgi:hypothetical protein
LAYTIRGLSAAPFQPLFAMTDGELAARNARRVIADASGGFPCRVSLREAEPGERLILVNHVSNDAATPFRASHAIYVREGAEPPAPFRDAVPALLGRRTLSLRGFDSAGMLRAAALALPGEADAGIRGLLAEPGIATIHAHNAALGCFLAAIERN